MSTATRGRPPLPPPHGSFSDKISATNEGSEGSQTPTELKPQPATRSLVSERKNSRVEKDDQNLEQEVTNHTPPQPSPRRRLASFGGVGSPGSASPYTGIGAYNPNNSGTKPATGPNMNVNLSSLGSRGSTGCLRLSPQSSGRSTPVTGLGPMHLQSVRDQMVVALQRLKELEEQVKIIPILQVKISVLKEEKRQLVCQLRNQSENNDIKDAIWQTGYRVEIADVSKKVSTVEEHEVTQQSDCWEFRELTEEMEALEKTLKSRHLPALEDKSPLNDSPSSPVAHLTDKDRRITLSPKQNKYVCSGKVETKSVALQVSEVNLGIHDVRELESDAQQLIISAMKERINDLETELKESALQAEMCRMKLELQAAGARSRADKASLSQPSTTSTGTQARPRTESQGVGNHTEVQDACTGDVIELKTVGVSCCGPERKNVGIGPDLPMSHWDIREVVETSEKGVEVRASTKTRGIGTEQSACDAASNTDIKLEDLEMKKNITCRSVACGDCSVNVTVCETKEMISRGMITEPIQAIDLGIMASLQSSSQDINSTPSSVSRFTNTRHVFNLDSSTNTVLSTQDKHTNTTQTVTRNVSVGQKVRKCSPETRTIGVGTAHLEDNTSLLTLGKAIKTSRDTGVGYTNINDNFLVGLKTRNMASGPSHLPDPIRTKSIGVGEGKIRDFSVSPSASGQAPQHCRRSQWDPDLNHYIGKMQQLLREHGDLFTEDPAEQGDGFIQQHRSQEHTTSTLPLNNKDRTEIHPFEPHPSANRDLQPSSQRIYDSSKCYEANPGTCPQATNDSEVKRMIYMLEQQTSSSQQDRPVNSGELHHVIKKHNGDQSCSNTRKNMRFMRVTSGLDPNFSASEKVKPEEVDRRSTRKLQDLSQDERQTRLGKAVSNRGTKGLTKSHTQQRSKLSEKMFSACQALKIHLGDDTVLSKKELLDCLQTCQLEWFSVSSHKSAAPDSVEDHLSAFRVISRSVLQHIVNMADGNGNTALHYCVSHSNFAVVKKLLDSEVCNVNQQNKAGYTPIMLAALAAVERPEDMRVVELLFSKGDINAKASQAGQTALMLAVSHGRRDMVQALLARGAKVNLQDDEGSSALMCASEHGHADIVKLLLAQPDCDATLTDSDESTALSVALDAGHNDIAVLLYAHTNFSKAQPGAAAHY